MKYSWTDTELRLLSEYTDLGNEIASSHPDTVSEEMIQRKLILEARLLILDKYVIGYLQDEVLGIYSFKEALLLESAYLTNGKLFFYLPVLSEVSKNRLY